MSKCLCSWAEACTSREMQEGTGTGCTHKSALEPTSHYITLSAQIAPLRKKLILSVLQKKVYLSVRHKAHSVFNGVFSILLKDIQYTIVNAWNTARTAHTFACTALDVHTIAIICMQPPPSCSCKSLKNVHNEQYSAFLSHSAGRVYKGASVIILLMP